MLQQQQMIQDGSEAGEQKHPLALKKTFSFKTAAAGTIIRQLPGLFLAEQRISFGNVFVNSVGNKQIYIVL
jgi:hypothetical protein